MVGKPTIARKIYQIPYNFLFFATFGDKRGLFSMQLAYVLLFFSLLKACVREQYCSRVRTCSKKWFFKRESQQ
jgi:hypothetical protein